MRTMNTMTPIFSISILLFNLIPQINANSANVISQFIYTPGTLPLEKIQVTSSSVILPNESITSRDNGNYNFVAVGDWGCTEETDKTITNIFERDPSLIVGLGDYSYSQSAQCWLDKIKPIEDRLKIVLGNHENGGNYGLNFFEYPRYTNPDDYMNRFGLDSQYYSFDYGSVHFVMMSTEVPYEKDSPQYEFVSNDLKQVSENAKTKWIIVANHRTVYPPYYGPTATLDNVIGNKFRDTYHPLFDAYGVDLVLQGHVHHYQRTYPLKYNITSPDAPIIIDRHTNHYIKPMAPIFITAGTGGVEIGRPESIVKPYYAALGNNEVFGILDLEIWKDGSTLEGTFYNNNGTGKPHAQDIFTINK